MLLIGGEGLGTLASPYPAKECSQYGEVLVGSCIFKSSKIRFSPPRPPMVNVSDDDRDDHYDDDDGGDGDTLNPNP